MGLALVPHSRPDCSSWPGSSPFRSWCPPLEAGDSVEITVRTATQVRKAPLRVLLILLSALFAGSLAWLAIAGVVVATLGGAVGAFGAVFDPIGPVATPSWPGLNVEDGGSATSSGTSGLSVGIIESWNALVISFAFAWIPGFLLHAGTRGYLVLRRSVERLPFDELGEPGPSI